MFSKTTHDQKYDKGFILLITNIFLRFYFNIQANLGLLKHGSQNIEVEIKIKAKAISQLVIATKIASLMGRIDIAEHATLVALNSINDPNNLLSRLPPISCGLEELLEILNIHPLEDTKLQVILLHC